jgi:hypothetical protein
VEYDTQKFTARLEAMNGPHPHDPEKPHTAVTERLKEAIEIRRAQRHLDAVRLESYIVELTAIYEEARARCLEKQQQLAEEREEHAVEDPYLVSYDVDPIVAKEWMAPMRAKEENNAPEEDEATRDMEAPETVERNTAELPRAPFAEPDEEL